LAKRPAIPTIAMARIDQPKVGTAEWMARVADKHGSTKPAKLEHRRRGLSVQLAVIENTVEVVNTRRKQFETEAEKRSAEVCKAIEKCGKELEGLKGPEAEAKKVELAKLENMQRALVQEYRIVMTNFDVAIANLQFSMAQIEIGCLVIDHLGIRIPAKSKSGKEGFVRYSAAAYLSEVGWGVRNILSAIATFIETSDEEEGDEKEEAAEPAEASDKEIFGEEDEKEIAAKEAAARKGAEAK